MYVNIRKYDRMKNKIDWKNDKVSVAKSFFERKEAAVPAWAPSNEPTDSLFRPIGTSSAFSCSISFYSTLGDPGLSGST